MSGGTVFTKIQIEFIILSVKTKLFHAGYQLIVIVLTLAAADDLSDARNETVHGSDRLVVLVHLHVERLDLLRIVGNEYRTFKFLFCQVTLMFGLQIAAPAYLIFKLIVVFLKNGDGVRLGHMGVIRLSHVAQTLDETLIHKLIEELHLFRCIFQHIVDDIF